MAEERRCEAPRLCSNNCGFFGSPATQNLCSKCYRDLQLKEQQSSSAKQAFSQTLIPPPSSPSPSTTVSLVAQPSAAAKKSSEAVKEPVASAAAQATPNRCLTCRKRVGLTGFKCRCGMIFCGTHRYPEQHDCAFDFKSLGKEQIAKANPVVVAEKLEKI